MKSVKFNSWNSYSTRFVHPPKFTWEKVDNAVKYRVGVAGQKQRKAAWFETTKPEFDFALIWNSLPLGRIDMLIHAPDAEGQHMEQTAYVGLLANCYAPKSFYKVPDWNGEMEQPMDWMENVHCNVSYLLEPARDEVKPYEKGLPRFIWSCTETRSGGRGALNYVSRNAVFLDCLFRFAEKFPESQLTKEACRQAVQYGEWMLAHHLPDDCVYSRFPFTTVRNGNVTENAVACGFEGNEEEGRCITIDQAAGVASSMIKMTQITEDQQYLDYARHIADIFVEKQRDDGTWPMRVDPITGHTPTDANEYNASIIKIAKLMAQMDRALSKSKPVYRESCKKAIEWILANPVKTKRWQSSYEDVKALPPYRNLSATDALVTIRMLLYFKDEISNAVDIVLDLNKFVEDQFVVWNLEESNVLVQCPTPSVLEQYSCYHPMTAHTGNWLLALAALHYTTGDRDFLAKGVAAANSMCRNAYPDGIQTTWGADERFSYPLIDYTDWPCINAMTSSVLMLWDDYYRSVINKTPKLFDLIGGFW